MIYSVQKIIKFFTTSISLKKIPRAGWISKIAIKNPESVAEHVYSMCIMSMVISDLLDMNTERAMKMTCLHDLAESIIGDLMPEQISSFEKRKLEDDIMHSILLNLPTSIRRKYLEIWDEYIRNESDLSNLIHKIDKLEMAFQAKNYEQDGVSRKLLKAFLDSAEIKIGKDKKDIISELLQTLNSIN